MNKKFIIIIGLAISIMLGFNYLNTKTTNNNKITPPPINIETSKDEAIVKELAKTETKIQIDKIDKSSNRLSNEIEQLLNKANNLLELSKEEEALKIYDLIIEKIGNSQDPILLKYFASVYMTKGYIYQLYPNMDSDAAMEAFNMIINKFENSNNPELIELYIDAKIQLSYLLSNDEKIEIYNELLSKFEKNLDSNIQKRVESLLISKSFQLMGNSDEEAMQILDKVIERYQEKNASVQLPENIQYSILNNIELALITNNESDKYVELAKKFMSNSPDTKPLLDMLDILKNSQDLNQDEALKNWKKEHGDYHFPDWSFQEVEKWAYQIEDKETKERVSKYINAFVNQKYNIPDKYPEQTIYDSTSTNNDHHTYDSPYSNQEDDLYSTDIDTTIEENSEEKAIEDEMTEEEIYQSDIYQDDGNSTKNLEIYSNPYDNTDPYVDEIYDTTDEHQYSYE
jgi:tetratricopeptide (TPR) repeat protein